MYDYLSPTTLAAIIVDICELGQDSKPEYAKIIKDAHETLISDVGIVEAARMIAAEHARTHPSS